MTTMELRHAVCFCRRNRVFSGAGSNRWGIARVPKSTPYTKLARPLFCRRLSRALAYLSLKRSKRESKSYALISLPTANSCRDTAVRMRCGCFPKEMPSLWLRRCRKSSTLRASRSGGNVRDQSRSRVGAGRMRRRHMLNYCPLSLRLIAPRDWQPTARDKTLIARQRSQLCRDKRCITVYADRSRFPNHSPLVNVLTVGRLCQTPFNICRLTETAYKFPRQPCCVLCPFRWKSTDLLLTRRLPLFRL